MRHWITLLVVTCATTAVHAEDGVLWDNGIVPDLVTGTVVPTPRLPDVLIVDEFTVPDDTLWLITGFALVCLVARWLLALPAGEIANVTLAAGIGVSIGLAVCFITQHVIAANVTMNLVLVTLVAFAGVWFSGHFGSYILGVLVGAFAIFPNLSPQDRRQPDEECPLRKRCP